MSAEAPMQAKRRMAEEIARLRSENQALYARGELAMLMLNSLLNQPAPQPQPAEEIIREFEVNNGHT
ncbi:MAG: hypothetical protein KKB20_26185 [Proteobacteria bacterium]|nr:hypothetical protein [Pseudomonadota bacterium]